MTLPRVEVVRTPFISSAPPPEGPQFNPGGTETRDKSPDEIRNGSKSRT